MKPHSDYHNGEVMLTNSEFLRHVAASAPSNTVLWVNGFIGNPNGSDAWRGFGYLPGGAAENDVDRWAGRQNAYFSVGSFRELPGERYPQRRKANFVRLLCLVVDDADYSKLLAEPSWVFETSPGNYQVGFLLDGADPQCEDRAVIDGLVTQLVSRGLIGGDISGNNIARYVRLPQGQNQKPRDSGHWDVRVTHWNPERRLSLRSAAGALGIDLDAAKAVTVTPALGSSTFGLEQDEKLLVAASNINTGADYHESINVIAASLVASGAHPGTVTNLLRAIMQAAQVPRDDRWEGRYKDIPRAVTTASQKFQRDAYTPISADTGQPVEPVDLFVDAADLISNVSNPSFLIDGYLETGAMSLVFGPSGVGKSFIVYDMACCVATGTPWHGHAVKPGPVFLICGEGHAGVGRRIRAWSQHNSVPIPKGSLYVSRKAILLGDEEAAAALAHEIDRLKALAGAEPAMVVVDTVARSFGGGDENSARDMGVFISNCDTYIKRGGTNLLLVHHSGKDTSSGARGSSALRAALDQEFAVAGFDGRMTLTNTKMKDAEPPKAKDFKIRQLEIAQDEFGDPILGATIVLDSNPLDVQVGARGDGKTITATDVVRAFYDDAGTVEGISIAFQVSQTTAGRILQKMASSGFTEKSGRGYKLTEKTEREAQMRGINLTATVG